MNLAFISYSHHDVKVAEWLQKKLEHYRLPGEMSSPVDPQSHYLRPVFRDRTDLTSGVLSEIIDNNLENSMYLIVICSRRAAKSQWVSKETQYFIEHGKMNKIIPLVIDGIPYSGGNRECVPKYMRDYVVEHPEKELRCIDKVAEGDNRAFMQIVSRLMDVPFDVMYGRHRRRRNLILGIQILAVTSFLCIGGYFITPISASVQIRSVESMLPQEEGILNVGGQAFAINNYDTIIEMASLPGYLRGQSLEVLFTARYYDTLRTTMDLGFGVSANKALYLKRDNTFALFHGHIIDEEGNPVEGALVSLAGQTATTDSEGLFSITLPDEIQAETQSILITKDGYEEIYREDECPGELYYIIHPAND